MAYGIRVAGPQGQIWLDSTFMKGGVLLEVLTIQRTAGSGSKTYADEDLYGRQLVVVQKGPGAHNWSVDTSGGYPRLNWTVRTYVGFRLIPDSTQWIVYAK